MKNLKIVLLIIILLFSAVGIARADAVIDNGINFLKSKQDTSGQITGGYSSASQWGAIAFVANNINPGDVKISPEALSLRDYLLTNVPANGSAATEWESRILAIVAMGDDPTNFGGVNYLQNLEGFYNNNQLGETYLLNDDIFGLLALVASGNVADPQIKHDVLDFIIIHQAANGGFSWSPDTTCQYCDPTPDMTAAAIQALKAAKDNNLINTGLDEAITRAKGYLLVHQNNDGGFPGWSGTSDADATSEVLMAFNVLGMQDSQEALAKNWLVNSQQLDGGFPAWNGSDTTITSKALIALLDKGWLLKIFTPSLIPSPTPSVSPTPTPTPSPTPTPTSTPTPTPTPSSSPTPMPSSTPTPSLTPVTTPFSSSSPAFLVQTNETISVSPSPEVLGEVTSSQEPQIPEPTSGASFKKIIMLPLGVLSIFMAFFLWRKGRT